MSFVPYLSGAKWLPIGPAPTSTPNVSLGFSAGRVEVAAPDPTNANVMYIGADNGGVWKSPNWLNPDPPTWIPLTDDAPSLDFGGYHSLLVHPADHNLILGVVCGPGAGILKSPNGGVSWQVLANGQFEGTTLGSIAVHPTDLDIMYVSVWVGSPAASAGVYRSTDGGLTWQNTTMFHAGSATDVVVAKFSPNIVYAGLVANGQLGIPTSGVYRSLNGGNSWEPMDGSLPSSFFLGGPLGGAVRIESASSNSIVYVTLFAKDLTGASSVSRFRTSDGGESWIGLAPTPGEPEFRPWHLLLAVNDRNADHVFVNDAYALYESKDGGKSWKQADKPSQAWWTEDWVNMTFDHNNNGVVTSDRNVFLYDHHNKTWLAREGNLQITEFYDITLDPQKPDNVYGVAQDHFCAMKCTESVNWAYMQNGGGEVGKVLTYPTSTAILFVCHPFDPANLVKRSDDGGQTWSTILAQPLVIPVGAEPPDLFPMASAQQKSFVMDPSQPMRLLVASIFDGWVLETKDALGNPPTWKFISETLSPSGSASDRFITALAIAPSNGSTVYAATGDGHVWVTENGGQEWKQRDDGLFGAKVGAVVGFSVDPADPKRAFAVVARSGGQNVWFLSQPATGYTWLDVSGDLPTNLTTASLYADWQYATPALWVGTDRGVYHSVNVGGHWEKFGLYLPNTLVADLQALPKWAILAAGTFGRGAWAMLIRPSKIGGLIFDDLDGDGIMDANDKGMADVTVFLDPAGGRSPNAFALRTQTNVRGEYAFENVPPATYTLRQLTPVGYVQTTPKLPTVTVNGSDVKRMDFGNSRRPGHIELPHRFVADLNVLPGRRPAQRLSGAGEANSAPRPPR
jgi:photosystem II stability/assembly factor-like uncharacterized protein